MFSIGTQVKYIGNEAAKNECYKLGVGWAPLEEAYGDIPFLGVTVTEVKNNRVNVRHYYPDSQRHMTITFVCCEIKEL